ncbi:hypothetical protein VIGAN_11251700 [Vigna angularis var. angularis]|uniref:Uncharacterized protein n=1 Tax=Vigna angularis var. angularis TaxID=157739 RepID=A0A0S3TCN3_PHAAN|nr:hypothetical protein VIGAN_11251700 [Vigna angularis var. angularis]
MWWWTKALLLQIARRNHANPLLLHHDSSSSLHLQLSSCISRKERKVCLLNSAPLRDSSFSSSSPSSVHTRSLPLYVLYLLLLHVGLCDFFFSEETRMKKQ